MPGEFDAHEAGQPRAAHRVDFGRQVDLHEPLLPRAAEHSALFDPKARALDPHLVAALRQVEEQRRAGTRHSVDAHLRKQGSPACMAMMLSPGRFTLTPVWWVEPPVLSSHRSSPLQIRSPETE